MLLPLCTDLAGATIVGYQTTIFILYSVVYIVGLLESMVMTAKLLLQGFS